MKVINESANGATIELGVNASVELNLAEARTSGYRWVLEDAGAPTVEIQDRGTAPNLGTVGGPGLHAWLLTARQPGEAHVRLRHSRSWEAAGSGTPFSVTVSVTP